MAECCEVDFSVVARHLALLADAEVVECRKESRTVFYKVRYDALQQRFLDLASAFSGCCTLPGKGQKRGVSGKK